MKKLFFFLLIALTQVASSQAFDIEARAAYFLPQDSRVRHIYGKNGFAEYELEASMPLSMCCDCSCDWDMFTNVSFYQKRGHSSCLDNRTKMTNWAINLGIKRYFDFFECVRPYLGFGIGAANVHFRDHSEFVRERTNRWGFAILAKSGIEYELTCNLFLDLFADYSYHWFHFPKVSGVSVRRHVNTGGLKLGLGLGYQF